MAKQYYLWTVLTTLVVAGIGLAVTGRAQDGRRQTANSVLSGRLNALRQPSAGSAAPVPAAADTAACQTPTRSWTGSTIYDDQVVPTSGTTAEAAAGVSSRRTTAAGASPAVPSGSPSVPSAPPAAAPMPPRGVSAAPSFGNAEGEDPSTPPAARTTQPPAVPTHVEPRPANAGSGQSQALPPRDPMTERTAGPAAPWSDLHPGSRAEPGGMSSRPVAASPEAAADRPAAGAVAPPQRSAASGGAGATANSPAAAVRNDEVLFARSAPSLVVESAGPREVIVGRPADYKVRIRNRGDIDAQDVLVVVSIPGGVEVVHAQASSGVARSDTSPASGQRAEQGVQELHWTLPRVSSQRVEELALKLVPRSNQPLHLSFRWSSAAVNTDVRVEVREPKLELQLTGPKEVAYGEKAVYTLTFRNPGTADADDVRLTLQPIERDGSPETHPIGTIAAGGKLAVQLELVARQSGMLAIAAEAVAAGDLRAQVHEEVLVRRAELVVQARGPEFCYARTAAVYQVRVSNTGNDLARNVQVGAVLPPHAVVLSSSAGGKVENGGRISWSFASLAPGEDRVLEVRCELEQAGANKLDFVAIADKELRQTAECVTDVRTVADLDLDVLQPAGPVPVSQEATYEITVTNRGTRAAQHVELAAFFSRGIEPVAVVGGRHEIQPGKVLIGPIASIAPGEQMVYRVQARAEEAGNHVIRVELACPEIDVQLAEQKTTRFYGQLPEERMARRPQGASHQAPTPAAGSRYEPIPLHAEPQRLEPTPAAPIDDPFAEP